MNFINICNFYAMEQQTEELGGVTKKDNQLLSLLNSISLETESEDRRLDMILISEVESSESEMFNLESNFSVEGITDTIKNKASRATSSFITMAKKAMNFIFGFVINLFKASINSKKVLKKVYGKAKSYKSKIDELASKSFPNDFEIESKDYAKRSNASLILLRSIIDMTQESVKQANSSQEDDPLTRGVKLALNFSELLGAITDKNAKVAPADVIGESKKNSGDVKKGSLYTNFINSINTLFKNGWNGILTFLSDVKDSAKSGANTISSEFKFAFKNDPSGLIKEMEERGKRVSAIVEKYSSDPTSKTVKASQIFPYYRNQLQVFLDLVNTSSWDFEKAIKSLETLRNKSIKSIDKLKYDDKSEQAKKNIETNIRYSMQLLSAMGKGINDLKPLISKLLNNINSDMESLMTEVAKALSKASKI